MPGSDQSFTASTEKKQLSIRKKFELAGYIMNHHPITICVHNVKPTECVFDIFEMASELAHI